MTTGPKEPLEAGDPASDERSGSDPAELSWATVPTLVRRGNAELPPPWEEVFGPLRRGALDDLVVIGQFGQSIDARVATASGHSHYINGPDALAHLHRLRAVVDAVVIGVGTALADDPQLTVRRATGPNPARVVIDPAGRLAPAARVFAADGVRRIVVTRAESRPDLPAGVEAIRLPAQDGAIAPADILATLAGRGLRRILIEGGADTVSRFLAARCLDRVHVLVAPIFIGSGRPSVSLPEIARVDQAMRAKMRVHTLGEDLLLDCDLSAQRVSSGVASRST